MYIRNGVGSSSDGLLARLAVPDADRVSLHGGLSAECADIFGVLSDFHLLDLLSEGSTVSARKIQRLAMIYRCILSFPIFNASSADSADTVAGPVGVGEVDFEICVRPMALLVCGWD